MYRRNHPCGGAISPKDKNPPCGLACGSKEVSSESALHMGQVNCNEGDHYVSYVIGARECESVHSMCFASWGRLYRLAPKNISGNNY